MVRFGGNAAASWRVLLLSLLWAFALAKKSTPDLVATKFDHPPLGLSYFEDSDVVVFHDVIEGNIYRSSDAGASWKRVSDIPEGVAGFLRLHAFDSNTAFVLTGSTKHWKTENRGESWTEFSTGTSYPSQFQPEILIFHADDPKRIIFNGQDSQSIFGSEEAIYTTDGFDSVDLLRAYTEGCWWAKSSPEFTTGDSDLDKKRTLCIIKDPFSFSKQDQRLVVSDSFFAVEDDSVQEFEPDLDINHGVTGVVSMAVVKKFLLVATSSWNSDEMALYVTDDTLKWHRAIFPTDDSHDHSHRIYQEAYTIMESTNYSIQVDVMTSASPSRPMGVLFTSNSNGTYFIENVPNTNRNMNGHVDFEKITGIQGVFLVNVVQNAREVDEDGEDKVVVTQISFDDGRTFDPITAGEKKLHLHSITKIDNMGRVFSSPAPGLVMGNGNTGKSLGEFKDADLYISSDAGLTWKRALKGPHKYEFGGSGSVLIAIKDSSKENVDEFSYSLDYGESWESVSLPEDLKFKPDFLTTTQDSTSLKFLLLGERDGTYHMIAIDFDGLDKRTCGDKDMEAWHARVDEDNKPTCIMGHKQTYQRRKQSADCFVKNEFKDPVPETEDCECTDMDFECDYNFQRDPDDRTKCKKVGPIPYPEGECKKPDDSFLGSSGWRLIPGNTCKRTKGEQKDDEVERDCSGTISAPTGPGSGEPSHTQHSFDADLKDFEKIYLVKGDTSSADDETVIVRPAEPTGDDMIKTENKLWLTSDHGKKWSRILEGETIRGIYPHEYLKDVVYFTTDSEKVIYTIDRGQSFHSFKAPSSPSEMFFPLAFHPDKKDWLIWLSEVCDKVGGSKSCFTEASITTDRGDNWRTLMRYVRKCDFTGNSKYRFRPLKQIVCLAREEERDDSPLTLVISDDLFVQDKTKFDGEVTDFATMSEFIVVARQDEETGALLAMASLDGKLYETAHFPFNFHEDHGNSYTVLDSSTHAVNLFVRTEGGEDREYGSIIKSNSNGTSYVLSASNVNCNEKNYVDFEKVAGLEGVTLINIVTNANTKDKTKKIQTKISHNDGSEWGFLKPPTEDAKGDSYKCKSSTGDESCALHLHHYTERDDKRKTFAAVTAVGLLFGVGNVGSHLGDMKDADTFMTTDGGITWKSVKKGHWTWQYGDQGSIIVLVQRATRGNDIKTNIVSYSVDEGKSWTDYKFADEEVTVLDLTTVSSGTSRNFLLWCRSGNDKLFSVNLDFTGLADEPCKFDEQGGDSDYVLWSPKHPLQDDDCLFGHVAKYLRKKTDSKCYNEQSLQRLYKYTNCACGRRDYECAYNYELDNHGQCALVRGLEPLSGQEWCDKHPNETSWFEPTGYRKVPLSTCEGGNELDKTSTEHPCAGFEDEFERKHRTSGVAIFFAVVIPCALAGFIGWYVYKNWSGKFGQIRLGDGASSLDSEQPWIKYPVIVIAAVGAMFATLPLVATSLWRTATGAYSRVSGGGSGRSWFSGGTRRFTTRDSFARGRGDYSSVEDEGELLGEDSDDEA